ncbi:MULTISPECIES: acyltransferase family protein [Rhizobium]|jgi:peptidoglycan/LPS O-acetylase OafA/YrhL|uniref:acyltransferase family protein n=1 Tax=Rhizobium TaxID=379 RepID=UPI001C916849|nr:acyltransferase [Rhizobium leguminosarum]MBY2944186.1 acyltransferase [Rhizobium leguminosarum]
MNGTEWVKAGNHLPELDGIRGAAVLMVVLLHTLFGIMAPEFQYQVPRPLYGFFFGGGGGVDLFFVLSGFLIGGILVDHRDAENYFKVFWIRRAARILPVYLLLMVTYVVAKHIGQTDGAPWFHAFLMVDQLPTWAYLTFTQNYFMAAENTGGARWVGITWSLAVEEQFYLVFPFVVFFLPKKSVMKIALAILILAPILRGYLWEHYGFYVGYFPTPARADGLMFGVLAAYLIRSPKLQWLADRRIILDILAGVAIYTLMWPPLWIGASAPFSLRSALFAYAIVRIFITDGIYRKILRSRFMVFMGLISYSFYMYHQAINGLFHGYFLNQVPRIENWSGVAVGVSVLLVSGTLATLSTRYFEKPFRDLGKRFKYRLLESKNKPVDGASVAHA